MTYIVVLVQSSGPKTLDSHALYLTRLFVIQNNLLVSENNVIHKTDKLRSL